MDKKEFKQKFDQMVSATEKIYITSHEKPDDDAVASALGTYAYVTRVLHKPARVLVTGEATEIWKERDEQNSLEWVPDFLEVAHEADLVIFLDGCEYSRFGKLEESFDPKKTKTICIDHHPGEPDKFDLIFQDTSAAAAAQIVYEIFFSESEIDKDVAEDLMYGILADSGNFKFVDSYKSRVLGVAEDILNKSGLNIQLLSDTIERISEKAFEAVKVFVNNTTNMTIPGVPPLTYSFISHEDAVLVDKANSKGSSSFYMFNFLRKIEGHKWGFVVRPESPTKYNISFRSSPNVVNVRELAMKFNGGGHILAAGGEYVAEDTSITAEDVCKIILKTIEENKDQIVVKS